MTAWLAGVMVGESLALASANRMFKMAAPPTGLILVATFQWLILRQHFRGAGWWIAASFLGLVIGAAATVAGFLLAGGAIRPSAVSPATIPIPLLGALLGAGQGAVTGMLLSRLCRWPVPAKANNFVTGGFAMQAERTHFDLGLWLKWVLGTILGFGLGAATFGTFAALGGEAGVRGSTFHLLGLVLFGLLVGVAQWMVIRRKLDVTTWWVVTPMAGLMGGTTAGYPLGSAIGRLLGGPSSEFSLAILTTFLLAGAGVGVLQFLILRRQIERAGWWIPANSLAYLAGGAVSLALSYVMGLDGTWAAGNVADFFVAIGLITAAGGAALGAITATALAFLLPRPGSADARTTAASARV